MASKKKPTAAQLAARAKFTAMVKAKAAARKKTAKKVSVKKVAAKKMLKYWSGTPNAKYSNDAVLYHKSKSYILKKSNENNKYLIIAEFETPMEAIKAKKKFLGNDYKLHFSFNNKISGLDKITRKGKKTIVHYSRLNGIVKPTPTIQKLVKNIKSKIEYNNHTEAVLLLAKHLKNKDAIFFLNAIIAKHKSLNYMPEELQKARDYYQKELLNIAKLKLTGANYEAIKNAF